MKKPHTYLSSFTIFAIIILVGLYFPVYATETVSTLVTGIVKTSDGKPAELVNISIIELKRGAVSDENGFYVIRNVPDGVYTFSAAFIGLHKQEQRITIVKGEVLTVNFTLRENAQKLNEVIIIARRTANEVPVTVGKARIKPLDLPQSIAIVTHAVIEQQQSQTLGDVLKNVNGVYQMGATGGFQEEIAGRGYAFGSSNTFKNGSRFNNGVKPEISSLEKVEVLKGSAAILFGNVAAGGVLNLVTKKPKFDEGGEVSMRLGSYNYYKPAFDFYGSINNSQKAAYRINGTYENAGSFRNGVSSERVYFNPSFLYKLSPKTELLLEADYLKDNRTPDYGIGAISYSILNVPRSQFIGASWSNYQALQSTANATVIHQINTNWQIRAISAYQNFKVNQYGTARLASVGVNISTDGTWKRALQKSQSEENYVSSTIDFTGKLSTGKTTHTLLLGIDADRYITKTHAFELPKTYDVINVLNIDQSKQRTDVPVAPDTAITRSPIHRTGLYVQDLVSLSSKFKVLAGLRWSYQENRGATVTNLVKNTSRKLVNSYGSAFSPRLGLVYQPTKTTSVFVSYANSFTLNTGTDINLAPLAPSLIDQYEVGVKNDLIKGLVSANLTLYLINNSDLAQTAIILADGTPNSTNSIKELTGATRSKGLEVDLSTRPVNGFTFLAGYSFNDMRYTTVNGNKVNGNIKGERLRYNPAHTANGSVYYNFSTAKLKGLNVGLTAAYVGNMLAGRNTTSNPANTNKIIKLPDFTTFDLSAGYSLTRFVVRAKVSNLTNRLAYYAHDDNSINPIAPSQFLTTISYKF